nr:M48 family metalloprotease [uncultured Desulfuromonas sp.]
MRWTAFLIITLLLTLSGCAVNPVTGKNEIALVGESTEINTGVQNYEPSRQMQGGDYTTHPEINRYVQQVGQKLAAVSDRQLPYEFKVINDSTPNAWALPGGKIAINRGLLVELNNEAELAAVLGHEIVHAAARHGAKGMERGMLLQGAVLAASIASKNSEYSGLATSGAAIGAQLITQKYGRDAERESDYYGMQYMARAGYDPAAAIELQQTFVRLSEGQESNWLSGLFASHPPSQERVEANRETASTLPKGGELATDRYRQTMAPLFADREAYQAYDEGRKALDEGNTTLALALAEKALRLQPKEALFHSLRGDIRFKEQQFDDAITNYDRAIANNAGYFHFYLQRGLAKKQLGRTAEARVDLERSNEFLPTAPAQAALGQFALQRGDRLLAKQLFASAAQSSSEVGKQAREDYVRLDLSEHPENYLAINLALDRRGNLVIGVTNNSGLAVSNVDVQAQYLDSRGKMRRAQIPVSGTFKVNEQREMTTDIGPITTDQQRKALAVKVVAAQIVK